MAGTVTGKNARVRLAAHAAGTDPNYDNKTQSIWGLGDFSLTFDRGTIEQNLIGTRGNYFDQGTLSLDGSLTSCKFAASGLSDMLNNVLDTDYGTYKYLGVSGTVSTDTDATYLRWCLASCQVTGYDISIGDADTITEASIDFVLINPQDLSYQNSVIKG